MTVIKRIQHYSGAIARALVSGRLWSVSAGYLKFQQVEGKAVRKLGLTVLKGPFAGMRYIKISPKRGLVPKIIGSYEQELHPFIEAAISAQPDTILNVGSAEGYYAVGMARRLTSTQAYAYDIDQRQRDLCAGLIAANGMATRVHLRGLCDAAELQTRIEASNLALVIIDCEGCEGDLLDPAQVPQLKRALIIVEIHDFGGSTALGDAIKARFAPTHTIREVLSNPRNPTDYPELHFLSPSEREMAILDREARQPFLYLTPKTD